VSGALQELSLLFEDDVLPTLLVIPTMNEEYLHNLSSPFAVGPKTSLCETVRATIPRPSDDKVLKSARLSAGRPP
jgi:hypothetical protein